VAVSTGCIHSLIQSPAITNTRPDRKGVTNIPENLIRFSVGTEDIDELWLDLKQALEKI
jgi:cystathionine beta-lyase/cystathionine gamma-synthase